MNLSDWIKAATLVTQHKQEAAIAETDQLSSVTLSQIAMDDSSPPVLHYGMHVPTATSTPTGTDVHVHSSQQDDSYQHIIPGLPQGSLYPTLSSLSSKAVASKEEVQSLRDKVSKGLDKYLQDDEQRHASELNYFDDTTSPKSEEPILEDAEQTSQPSECNPSTAKQKSIEDTDVVTNVLESPKLDTSCTLRHLSQVCTDADEKCQQSMTSEGVKQDTDAQQEDDEHSVEEVTRKTTLMHSEQLCTMLTCADKVIMLSKNVGCTLVASYLKQFLEDYPPPSDKQAYLNIYHMLSLLDKYLHNPKQHTHCISSDNEYVILLKYALCLNIDLTAFQTLWVVLSILLDTQDGRCEYIKCLPDGYNTQYKGKSRQYMLKLEEKLIEIQNRMHDSYMKL